MKYLSLFSGIGGFEVGISNAYENNRSKSKKRNKGDGDMRGTPSTPERKSVPTCIGFSEIDKFATQIYQKHFPKHKNFGDITKIDETKLPDFDLIVGGFPCQAFSVAGKRRGFDDTRGTLFFDIARIIRHKKPRLLLLENVKGLLSHDEGRTFATIVSTIDELGYDVQWQVLNSKNFGVPQNRERVLIVGHLRGTPRPEVFPFSGPDTEDTRIVGQDVAYSIDANYSKGTNTLKNGRRSIVAINPGVHQDLRVYDKDGLSPTLNANRGGGSAKHPFIYDLKATQNSTRRGVISNKGISKTLDHNCAQGIESGTKIRKLTPLECERLQGFPDNWTAGISDTQRYKCCGNAVTTKVIQAVMERILA